MDIKAMEWELVKMRDSGILATDTTQAVCGAVYLLGELRVLLDLDHKSQTRDIVEKLRDLKRG